MDSWVVLLGGNELNAGFLTLARQWNTRLCVVDWNERPAITGDKHLRLDTKDAAGVREATANLPGRVVLAFTSADVATESTAQVNAEAGLARPSPEAILRAGNKSAMNAAWQKAGLLGKQYQPCREAAELARFALWFGGKLIVKPADSSSSRGITVVEAEELRSADWAAVFARAQGESLAGGVIAEEFVEGTEYTVEMVGDAVGGVEVWGISRKHHTAHTHKNRIAVKLHYNAVDLDDSRQERIARFAAECYRALGLTNALGHFEVLERRDGQLVPVEMAARSSGYIATHLVSVLSSAPGAYLEAYRSILEGGRVHSRLIPGGRASMYFFYDPPPGTWRRDGIGLMEFLHPSIQSLAAKRDRLVRGTAVARIDSDNERLGVEVLAAEREELILRRVTEAEAALYVACVDPAAP